MQRQPRKNVNSRWTERPVWNVLLRLALIVLFGVPPLASASVEAASDDGSGAVAAVAAQPKAAGMTVPTMPDVADASGRTNPLAAMQAITPTTTVSGTITARTITTENTDRTQPDTSSVGLAAALLPNGKVLFISGTEARLFDPATETYTRTGDLHRARYSSSTTLYNFTATVLQNGTVLIAGGDNEAVRSTAEIYDPATGMFTLVGSLTQVYRSHTATLLQDGTVLVVGDSGNSSNLRNAELYDPVTQTWSTTTSTSTHMEHTATLLPSGKVLVVGGEGVGPELYDPVARTWTRAGSANYGRTRHTATLLTNGKVLVVGGYYRYYDPPYLDSAELYDPATNLWTIADDLKAPRAEHTATLLPNGTVIVAGGRTTYDRVIRTTELYDPATDTWREMGRLATGVTGQPAFLLPSGKILVGTTIYDPALGASTSPRTSLEDPRTAHTATALPDGTVLIAGGESNYQSIASAEIYDPASQTFSSVASLRQARANHTATVLPSGKVLIVGGSFSNTPVASVELYDPTTKTFTTTGSLQVARTFHTATLLPNGKVLVVGGSSSTGALASAEVYDPATGTFAPTGALTVARSIHTATLLPDGTVLIAGGRAGTSGADLTVLASAEVYDPATETFTPTGSLSRGRYFHTATLLTTGKVLIVGGFDGGRAELYDPATRTFVLVAGLLDQRRSQHTATLLDDGMVLITGGTIDGDPFRSVERFDPATNTFTTLKSLRVARMGHTATRLPDGTVLLAGGYYYDFIDTVYIQSAERYDPVAGASKVIGSGPTVRGDHTATLLPNGKVLVVGGSTTGAYSDYTYLDSVDLYDPVTGTYTETGKLTEPRSAHTATLLPNGKVLVVGGVSNAGTLASAELYDPTTGIWTATGSLNVARRRHTATLLPNGKVLVVGGDANFVPILSAELYDPATGIWTATGNLGTARTHHTATLLVDGTVVIAGGLDNSVGLASIERYDPTMGMFATVGTLLRRRSDHTATLLPDGTILFVGGYSASKVYTRDTEVYDPTTNTSAYVGPLAVGRSQHAAVLVDASTVLIVGGVNNTGRLASTEMFDPSSRTFFASGNLQQARQGSTVTLLPDDTILVHGGYRAGGELVRLNTVNTFSGTLTYPSGWISRATSIITYTGSTTDTPIKEGAISFDGYGITPWVPLEPNVPVSATLPASYYFQDRLNQPIILRLRDANGITADTVIGRLRVDRTSPTSSMTPLSSTSGTRITLRWAGNDNLSGVANFDLDVRDTRVSTWTPLLTSTTARTTTFTGQPGHTYEFRVRSRDVAGNVEDWPDTYDTSTTVESASPTPTRTATVSPTTKPSASPTRTATVNPTSTRTATVSPTSNPTMTPTRTVIPLDQHVYLPLVRR